MSRWFRMYDELLDDPKVQRLPGDDFKGWVNLLCLASRNDGILPSLEDMAFALRLDAKKADALFQRLVSCGLIVEGGNGFTPNKWDERQYKSDVSTERVKRFRKRSKAGGETPPETAPDTETDTEVPLSNDNGSSDAEFWASAKAYLGPSKASLIGQWARDFGKPATAQAITAAQLERPADKVSYIVGVLRKNGRAPEGLGVPC